MACYLTAFYNFTLEDVMIIKAIKKDHYHWLNYVWAFNKNYYDKEKGDKKEGSDKSVVTLEELFRLVINCFTDEGNIR